MLTRIFRFLSAVFAPARVPGNTFTTYEAVGQRENLTNIISNIDPTDTPFFSNIQKGDADAKFHEWQQDSLATPDTANAQLEGLGGRVARLPDRDN